MAFKKLPEASQRQKALYWSAANGMLLQNRRAPLTSHIEFVEGHSPSVAEALRNWWETARLTESSIVDVSMTPFMSLSLDDALERLLPIAGDTERCIVVPCQEGRWSAVFGNRVHGLGHGPFGSAERLGSMHVKVAEAPHSVMAGGRIGEEGFANFAVHAPAGQARSLVMLVGDGGYFAQGGEPLPFEDVSRYEARRVRDRLTHGMLVEYSRQLGLRPFDEGFYRPQDGAYLVEVRRDYGDSPVPTAISLEEARRRLAPFASEPPTETAPAGPVGPPTAVLDPAEEAAVLSLKAAAEAAGAPVPAQWVRSPRGALVGVWAPRVRARWDVQRALTAAVPRWQVLGYGPAPQDPVDLAEMWDAAAADQPDATAAVGEEDALAEFNAAPSPPGQVSGSDGTPMLPVKAPRLLDGGLGNLIAVHAPGAAVAALGWEGAVNAGSTEALAALVDRWHRTGGFVPVHLSGDEGAMMTAACAAPEAIQAEATAATDLFQIRRDGLLALWWD